MYGVVIFELVKIQYCKFRILMHYKDFVIPFYQYIDVW